MQTRTVKKYILHHVFDPFYDLGPLVAYAIEHVS